MFNSGEHRTSGQLQRVPFPIEDFFSRTDDDALARQVEWLSANLHIDNSFFAGLLHVSEREFVNWRYEHGNLSETSIETLKAFWSAVLHILSFYNYDVDRVLLLFEYQLEGGHMRSHFDPPWTGNSLKSFLLKRGRTAADEVSHWLYLIRFGDSE